MAVDVTLGQQSFQVRQDGNAAVPTGKWIDIETGGQIRVAGVDVTSALAGASVPPPVVRSFTASTTYTPTPGMKYVIARGCGGGGGGGGCVAGGVTSGGAAAGGAGGSNFNVLLTAAQIGASQVITIGAAGVAGNIGGTGGGIGGTTSIGALISAPGGQGGGGVPTASSTRTAQGGAGSAATITVGTDLGAALGRGGANGFHANPTSGGFMSMSPGMGGGSDFGSGSPPFAIHAPTTSASGAPGTPGLGRGSGGGGGFSGGTGSAGQNGGTGSGGRVVITEYF